MPLLQRLLLIPQTVKLVSADSAITIELNEAIVNTDTSEITNSNVSNLVTLKDSASGRHYL